MKKLAIALVSLLLAALLAEAGARAWTAAQGDPHDAQRLAEEWRRLVDPSRRFVPEPSPAAQEPPRNPNFIPPIRHPFLHPYTGAEAAHDTGGVMAAFRQGFESDEYVIVVVGGSVAAAFGGTVLPWLEPVLGADPRFRGRRIRLLNFAHAAYKQPQQVLRIAYLLGCGYRPDAVINLDGFNEVAGTLMNYADATFPHYPSAPVWGALVRDMSVTDEQQLERAARLLALRREAAREAQRSLRLGFQHSALLGRYTLGRLRRIQAERFRINQMRIEPPTGPPTPAMLRAERQRRGPDFELDAGAYLEAGVQGWYESSLSLHALCSARGVHYLHVLQPTLMDEGAKPLAPEELALGTPPRGWLRGARHGYPRLRARIADLQARGVWIHDASRLFAAVEEPIYVDHCHLNQRGNEILVQDVLRAFLAHLPEGRLSRDG